ncbi:MAG: hypothetical protein A7315_13915 [Candidatus Altiarchaeales archaeon WOR_SM1_79]|nr:MAG: hypothetical protein A7315_13915 [Candidatus Altiarchaeales archaeon WOR_SM1_79]
MANKILKAITDNLIYLILAFLIMGLIAGQYLGADLKSTLKMLVLPVLFLMIYPMMINIKIGEVLNAFKDIKPVALSLFINFIISPIVAIGIANVFFQGNLMYAVGIYLIALLPTSGMTAAWTGLAKGNLNTALVLIAVNLLLSIFILPIYLKFLIAEGVPFDPMELFKQLILIVLLPMIAGDLTRRFILKKWGKERFMQLKPNFSGVSSIGVLMIVFIAMCMKSDKILSDIFASAMTLIPLIVFYGLMLTISILIGKFLLERGKAIALTYSTGMRDLSVAIAIAMLSFPEAVLLIAMGYMIQPPVAAAYMKYLRGEVRNVCEIMHKEIITVNPKISISEASKVMEKHNIGGLLVKKDGGFGIITERDIIKKVISQNKNPDAISVEDVMTTFVITIEHTKDTLDASELFLKHTIRHLPVVKDKEVIGIISIRESPTFNEYY